MSTLHPEFLDLLNMPFESRGRGSPFSEVPASLPSSVNVTLSDIEKRSYGVVLHKLRNGFNPNVALRASHPVMIVTPLEYAIVCGDWRMILILILEGGADPDYNAFNGVLLFPKRIGTFQAGALLVFDDFLEPNQGYAGLVSFMKLLIFFIEADSGVMDRAWPRSKVESAVHLAMFVNLQMGREVSTEKMFSDVRRHMSVLCVNSNRTQNIEDTEWNKTVVKTAKKTLIHLEHKAAAHGMPTQVASMILWEKFWFPNFLVEQTKAFLREEICAVGFGSSKSTDCHIAGFLSSYFDTDDDSDSDISDTYSDDSEESDVDNGSDADEDSSRKRRRAL